MIVGVAIKQNNQIYSLLRPNRHHNIIKHMVSSLGIRPVIGEQGFILDTGEFVDRSVGAKHALEINQISKLNWPPFLYSEDLW